MAAHHHGSDMPTSPRAVLYHTGANLCTILHTTVKRKESEVNSEKKTKKIELIKCSLCPQSFHPGIILNQHINLCKKYSGSIENFDESFSCKLCQFRNPIRSEILKHIKKKHPKTADLDNPEENSKIEENVEKEAIEIPEFQIPVTVVCIKVRTASFPRFWKNHP